MCVQKRPQIVNGNFMSHLVSNWALSRLDVHEKVRKNFQNECNSENSDEVQILENNLTKVSK